MSDNNMTQREYRFEIQSTAENIIEEVEATGEYPLGSDQFGDEVSEEVGTTANSHQWTVYSGYSMDILQYAENDPEEWYCFVDPERENNHRHVLDTMAYAAFRADLYEAAADLLAERREEALAA